MSFCESQEELAVIESWPSVRCTEETHPIDSAFHVDLIFKKWLILSTFFPDSSGPTTGNLRYII